MKGNKFSIIISILVVIVVLFVAVRVLSFRIDKPLMISFFEGNINYVVKQEPIIDSAWAVHEFGFVNNSGFYVEYGDGASVKVLVIDVGPKFPFGTDYAIVGTLTAGSRGFELIDGEDPFASKEREIYRRDNEGEWKKLNF
jgi:hypothetical protein